MKQKLLLTVLTLGMCSAMGFAQEKEYHVEDDGFEWYELIKYENGETYHGAQDKYGNTIIPYHKNMYFYYAFGSFTICSDNKKGIVDIGGHLIVPMEYDRALRCDDSRFYYPHIMVEKEGNIGIYNLFGKCLIPVSRKYGDISQDNVKNGESCINYKCKHGKGRDTQTKYSICDASGKVVFTTSKPYKMIDLIRDPRSGKYALKVYETDHWFFVDKNENILWDPNPRIHSFKGGWPIEIRTVTDGPLRKLNQAELNRIMFSANFLDGNTEYFAHASEYPMHKIGEKPSSNSIASSNAESNSSNNPGGGTTTVVVEHHRDPVPVQEWQQCPACYGSGQCSYVKCGGSGWYYIGDRASTCGMCHGSGKCSTCAGKGGHYITVYR